MTIALIVLAITNIASLIVMYKLVTQLLPQSEEKLPSLPKLKRIQFSKPKADPRGRALQHEDLQSIDEVDPNVVMQSLAESTGRLNDFREL